MKKNDLTEFFNKNTLLIIIFLAFVIRMVCFVSLQPWKTDVVKNTIVIADASEYHQLAVSLLTKKSFEDYNAFRTPGYPVLVAMLYSISSSKVWFVLLFQIFLSLISVLFVYKIALIIFSRKVGLFSAFLFAIDIYQAWYTITLLTDTFFVFLFLASIYYLCKSIKENNLLSIGLSALFLGMATLVRPISFLFPFIVIVFILFICNLKLNTKLVYSLVFGLIFMASISPWLFNNYSKYGEMQLSSISGSNLLFWNVAYTEVYKTGKPLEQVRSDLYDFAVKQGIDTTKKESFNNSRIYSHIAQKYIKENFILYCSRHFMGIVNMYTSLGTKEIASIFNVKSNRLSVDPSVGPNIFRQIIDFYQSKTIGEIVISLTLVPYLLINYLFALFGVFPLIRKKEKYVYLLVFIVLYFSILTGVVGLSRYRIPVMPFINILCVVGLLTFYSKIKVKFGKANN